MGNKINTTIANKAKAGAKKSLVYFASFKLATKLPEHAGIYQPWNVILPAGQNDNTQEATSAFGRLILGRLPEESDVSKLKEAFPNLRHVFACLEDFELQGVASIKPATIKDWQSQSVTQHQIAMIDFSAGIDNQKVLEVCKQIDALRKAGDVYIHCKAGKGRSWIITLCYLITKGYSIAWATELIKRQRPQVNPNKQQIKFVEAFAAYYQENCSKQLIQANYELLLQIQEDEINLLNRFLSDSNKQLERQEALAKSSEQFISLRPACEANIKTEKLQQSMAYCQAIKTTTETIKAQLDTNDQGNLIKSMEKVKNYYSPSNCQQRFNNLKPHLNDQEQQQYLKDIYQVAPKARTLVTRLLDFIKKLLGKTSHTNYFSDNHTFLFNRCCQTTTRNDLSPPSVSVR